MAEVGGLIVAGDRSGVGKTTVTLALLAALCQRGAAVQSFKVGPDYIDPMFHQAVTGRPCYNLDPILTSDAYVRATVAYHAHRATYVLAEGVMGLFDGATGHSDIGSTAHIARLLGWPVLLVIDCSRMARSVRALVQGYRSLDPRLRLAGVVLNRVGSDRHRQLLTAALADMGVPIVGVLPRQHDITIPDRHLGLVPTAELPQLTDLLQRLATLAQTCFDWPTLDPWLRWQGQAAPPPWPVPDSLTAGPTLAVAQDRAFSFYYPDNLEILRALGATLVPWSPLTATAPPPCHGLYFGGGFPEMFAAELAANVPLRQGLRQAIIQGLPTYAECGGLMYLAETLVDFDQTSWPMVGVLPTTVALQPRLTLGYRRATARHDSVLLAAGQQVWGHEFHRSTVSPPPIHPLYTLTRYDDPSLLPPDGWGGPRLHASYVHVHWGGNIEAARRFVAICAGWGDLV